MHFKIWVQIICESLKQIFFWLVIEVLRKSKNSSKEGIRDKIQMFHNTNRTKYNKKYKIQMFHNTNRTKYKHDIIQKNKIQIAKIQM